MNRLVLLGTTLGTIFTVSMIASPAIAGSIVDFTATTKSDNNELKAMITATTNVPTNGDVEFGYGILTEESFPNAILVTVTHEGFLDSVKQAGANDSKWHNHYIALADNGNVNDACPGLEVADMTYASPGDVRVNGEQVLFDGTNTIKSFNPLNGEESSFTAGKTPIAVISFNLVPVFDDGGDLTNICIDVNGLYPTK